MDSTSRPRHEPSDQAEPPIRETNGTESNARLTATTAEVLLVLLAAVGVTML